MHATFELFREAFAFIREFVFALGMHACREMEAARSSQQTSGAAWRSMRRSVSLHRLAYLSLQSLGLISFGHGMAWM